MPDRVHAGFERYLNLSEETVWGTTNATPTWWYLPYEVYGVKATQETRQADLFTGTIDRRHSQNYRYRVDGPLRAPLFGHQISNVSYAETLIRWAFDRPNSSNIMEVRSKTAELYDVVETKRQRGLRVNTAVISGSSAQLYVSIDLGLMGKDETTDAAPEALDETLVPEQTEFMFSDVTFEIGSVATLLEGFTISLNNALFENFRNQSTRSLLDAMQRIVDFNFIIKKESAAYDLLRRTTGSNETDAELVLKGLHNGTGAALTNYTTVTFTIPRMTFIDATEGGGKNEHATLNPAYAVLKPETANPAYTITYGNEA